MASSTVPAAASSSKTAYRVSLTSGTSYTVPAGVTYLNVTLYGGGGGTGNVENDSTSAITQGGTGGTTTFTGATSATGGIGGNGQKASRAGYTTVNGTSATVGVANSGTASQPAKAYIDAGTTGTSLMIFGIAGQSGQVISSTLTATAGGSIAYAIGAGGTGAAAVTAYAGAAGGSGRIDIEYWA